MIETIMGIKKPNEFLGEISTLDGLEEFNLIKALFAYELGYTRIDKKLSAKLNKLMEFYYSNDNITSFLNQELIDYLELDLEAKRKNN